MAQLVKSMVPSGEQVRAAAGVFLKPEVQVAGAVLAGAGVTAGLIRGLWLRHECRQKRARRTKACQQAIQDLRDRLNNVQISEARIKEILSWPLPELVSRLQNNQVTAVDVLHAYQLAALRAHDKTNCLVEPILEAETIAKVLDESTGPKGPLHGVPVSIKDNFWIKGYDSAVGCAKWIESPMSKDAVLIEVLKKQGAVPFVKTNVPQTMLCIDSCNPIHGQTTTPYDPKRTAGGSSGGEGAIIGAGGSILGMGSDIGGSIRIPSHFCGCCGFKPTHNRLSLKGVRGVVNGQNVVRTSFGPMAQTVDGLTIAMKALLGPDLFQMDSVVPPIPFRDEIYSSKKKLRIGYYSHDGCFTATPAMVRGVHVAKEALESLGHELVPIDVSVFVRRVMILYVRTITADSGRSLFQALEGDTIDHSIIGLVKLCSMNKTFKLVFSMLFESLMPNVSMVLGNSRGIKSVYEWYQNTASVEEIRHEVSQWWKEQGLDAVIAPTYAAPAMPIGAPGKATAALTYSSLYNALDFPAGSVPVSKVTEEDDELTKDYPVKDPMDATVKKSSLNCAGLPVSVQVVCLPWHEEQCLRVMKELESTCR